MTGYEAVKKSLIDEKVRDLIACGYCVLESVHDGEAVQRQEALLQAVWEKRGKVALSGFGMAIHPLLDHAPDIFPYFDCPEVNAVLAAAFDDRPRLCHTGARIASEASAENIGWHHHYGWDASRIGDRKRIERVVVNFYVKGASPAIGPLFGIPRRVNDPLEEPPADRHIDWPNQVEITVPPGSAVILDTALYHTAKRGAAPGMRYHWGGHYQGWSNPKKHSEDMDMTRAAEQTETLERYPGLRTLVLPKED